MAMFDFLKSANAKRLDEIVDRLKLTYSNAYKDDTQRIFKEFTDAYDNLKRNNRLSDKQIQYYDEVVADYTQKIDKLVNGNNRNRYYPR